MLMFFLNSSFDLRSSESHYEAPTLKAIELNSVNQFWRDTLITAHKATMIF